MTYVSHAYSVVELDEDEFSWSLEGLRAGELYWGRGSDTLAEGCEETQEEARQAVLDAAEKHDVDPKNLMALAF